MRSDALTRDGVVEQLDTVEQRGSGNWGAATDEPDPPACGDEGVEGVHPIAGRSASTEAV